MVAKTKLHEVTVENNDAPVGGTTAASRKFLDSISKGNFTMNTTVSSNESQVARVSYAQADDALQIKRNASEASLFDSLNERLIQAQALASMITCNGSENKDDFSLSHDIIVNSLWALESLIRQAHKFSDELSQM